MRASVFLRSLTPWGWTVVVAGTSAAVLIALYGLGFRWDPLGLAERRLRAAETEASVATADAAARRLEIEGFADQTRRSEQIHQQAVAVAQATTRAATQARSAQDAETPLDPDRAGRLVEHDRELCRLAPLVCGAAATDATPRRDGTLRPGAAADSADPGRS